MKSSTRISGEERRAAILRAVRTVFVEKGFDGTTTRALAEAAGVSEALLFKHFPSKAALYRAIQTSSFHDEGARFVERLRSLKPSTAALVFLVDDLVTHIVGGQPHADEQLFFRLIIRSLMDEGEFTRQAIQGPPLQWVRKVTECLKAAKAAGDVLESPVRLHLVGWFVHQLVTGLMLHALPNEPVIDYRVSREELTGQVIDFCLRGMGLREEAIRRCRKELRAPCLKVFPPSCGKCVHTYLILFCST